MIGKTLNCIKSTYDKIFESDIISRNDFQIILKDLAVRIMEINEREAKDVKKEE